MRLNPSKVRLKRTSENLETWKNSNFLLGSRGPLVMIFGGVGVGGSDWGVGQWCRTGNGIGSDGAGQWGPGGPNGRGGRGWQGRRAR